MDSNKHLIGILTWHYYSNVGSNLQAIAMQNVFTTDRTETEFINYRPKFNEPWYKNLVRCVCSKITDCFPRLLPEMFRFRAYAFQKRYMRQSKLLLRSEELPPAARKYDAVLCGSDQIWAPNVFRKEYMLNFVPDEIDKYSYAASIGLNTIPDELTAQYQTYLNRFRMIGVRETQGVQLISELLPDYSGKLLDVLDPTFLVPLRFWDEIAVSPKTDTSYLFCYFLGNQTWQRQYAADWAKAHDLTAIIYSNDPADRQYADRHVRYMGPREFIGYLKNAAHVMTDSFHGTVFSLIYQKQFHVFYRFDENDPLCQNSRIDNLIGKIGIGPVVIRRDEPNHARVDYDVVDDKLQREIRKSMDFVQEIIAQIGEDDG